ncbi:hypothetical protein ABIA00_002670 [Bradyrhizobium ottawaense]
MVREPDLVAGSRVPDALQREALLRRAGTQGRHGTMRMDGPRLCSAPLRAALRPGHESGIWRTLSRHRHCDAPMHIPACSAVGWAKAHSAVPTNSIAVRGWWARFRFAHPTISSLWHTAQLANTPSRPRGGFRPSFAWSLHPPIQEGAGKAGCWLAPAVRCAKCTRRKNRTAAYRWCRSLGLPCAVAGRLMP